MDASSNTWKPNSNPQRIFLGLPDDIFEGCYGGAAGGGKTEALIWYPIVRKFHEHPNYKGILFRRTFPQLEQSIIPRAREVYEDIFGAKYNESKHSFKFPSGAIEYLSYLNSDDDARKHDTAEYNLVRFEELCHFEEYHYRRLLSRCRSSSNLPAFVRVAATPGNVGHSWVRARFIEPDRLGHKILRDELTGLKRIFIPARAYDNPDLLRNTPDYVERLRLLPEYEAKALIDGDWWAFAGQVFSEFREKQFPDEPENALHVIEPITIPDWWPKVISIDWGYDHYTACSWHACSPDGRVYTYREYMVNKTYISNWAADIWRLSQYDGNILDIIIDPSANQNRGHPKTIKEQVLEEIPFPITDADNDRIAGKLVIHEMLRWNKKPPRYIPPEGFNQEIADRVLRINGLEAYKDYCSLFAPQAPETNLPKWQIFNTCRSVIDCIQAASIDEKKPEDVAKYSGDDMYDSVRYGLKRVHLYWEDARREERKHKSQADIVTEFHKRGGDYNYLAWAARDHVEKNKIIPISRVRRTQRAG